MTTPSSNTSAHIVVRKATSRAHKADLVLRGTVPNNGTGLATRHTEGVDVVELGADEVGRGCQCGAERAEEAQAGPVGEDQAGAWGHDEIIACGQDVADNDTTVGTDGGWVLRGR